MTVEDKNQVLKDQAIEIFKAGLRAVDPKAAIKSYCGLNDSGILTIGDREYDLNSYKRLLVIGAGKAGAPMAAAFEEICGDRIEGGLINVKYDHLDDLSRVKIVEAGHPVPDENGQKGSESIMEIAAQAQEDDLIICLISGGGSALLPMPAEGLTLADKQDSIKTLLSCGATIHEINAIRKHTSAVKGGRLALTAHPATTVSLILSDVVGDDLDVIASGPTVPDPSSFAYCMEVIEKYKIMDKLPPAAADYIQRGAKGDIPETPKSDDPIFQKTQNLVIGCNMEAVLAAKAEAEKLGFTTVVLSSMIEGETSEVAKVHGAIAKEIVKTGFPAKPPVCIISGGETTVTITGNGLGGRNQHFAIEAAIDIAGLDNVAILCAGTDGTDGPTDAAGAVVDGMTLENAQQAGISAKAYAADNDAYHFFDKVGGLIKTGPTNTNVMDLRLVLVGSE